MSPRQSDILVRGARVHNLRNVDVRIPRNRLTVITGLSGSGKSSLAFDTIYAEGQRRYVESLSSYARQFFGSLEKPDVDAIEGLSPALSIDQKSARQSPRSTVGTMSDTYDYLRLLFTRIGTVHCPSCQAIVRAGLNPVKTKRAALTCPRCGHRLSPLSMASFSFNSPEGACPDCQGLGIRKEINPALIIPNRRLTLAEGAIRPWSRIASHASSYLRALASFATAREFSLNLPVAALDPAVVTDILHGVPTFQFEGVIPNLERRHRETDSSYVRTEIEKYMVERQCPVCDGQRLRPEVLGVRISDRSIVDVTGLSIEAARSWVDGLPATLSPAERSVASLLIDELRQRLAFLETVNLGYLTLDRNADTLAGGEAQRIRLATQLGSNLTGVLYVLDEPTIGLHPADQNRLIEAIRSLQRSENTVIVVEHDRTMIEAADYVIDVGPGAGELGGRIVAQGTVDELLTKKRSLTAQYLRGERTISIPSHRRSGAGPALTIHGATAHNLKDITVRIPLGTLTCVTGVSGSGKSTLIYDILGRSLAKRFHRARTEPAAHRSLTGAEALNKVINIDQSPIGRTPRSNPATYTNLFLTIRDLFASTLEAVSRKLDPGHFSFNVKGGRCEHCGGDGVMKFEMHFLPDTYLTCPICEGKRYDRAVLDILYRGRSIADVLDMTVTEALKFFADVPTLRAKLGVLDGVGLGYMTLGQRATTLSGGEAQRVKLATELSRQDTGKTLYILDEPTSGLHFEDIRRLLGVIQALVDKGNTVLVIEHNVDVMKSADYIIDLGPGGGAAGGTVVAAGTPEAVARTPRSVTGTYLAEALRRPSVFGQPPKR
jgi:excinuclease ABC subunit A